MKIFALTIFLAVGLTQAYVSSVDVSRAVDATIARSLTFMRAELNLVSTEISDALPIDGTIRRELNQLFTNAINKSLSSNTLQSYPLAVKTFNSFINKAGKQLSKFEDRVSRSNAQNCQGFRGKARAVFEKLTKDAEVCADSTLAAVLRAGRIRIDSYVLEFSRRYVNDVNSAYLSCLANPNSPANANGTCSFSPYSIGMADMRKVNALLVLADNDVRATMKRALMTGENCLQRAYDSNAKLAQKVNIDFLECIEVEQCDDEE